MSRVAEILLVEDSTADITLTKIALADSRLTNALHVVRDGETALRFLKREREYAQAPRPDLVLLDLNLPRVDGKEVLAAIRSDPELELLPVVVLTTSSEERDIVESYKLKANNYIVKPVDMEKFLKVVKQIENFWVTVVTLPPKAA